MLCFPYNLDTTAIVIDLCEGRFFMSWHTVGWTLFHVMASWQDIMTSTPDTSCMKSIHLTSSSHRTSSSHHRPLMCRIDRAQEQIGRNFRKFQEISGNSKAKSRLKNLFIKNGKILPGDTSLQLETIKFISSLPSFSREILGTGKSSRK